MTVIKRERERAEENSHKRCWSKPCNFPSVRWCALHSGRGGREHESSHVFSLLLTFLSILLAPPDHTNRDKLPRHTSRVQCVQKRTESTKSTSMQASSLIHSREHRLALKKKKSPVLTFVSGSNASPRTFEPVFSLENHTRHSHQSRKCKIRVPDSDTRVSAAVFPRKFAAQRGEKRHHGECRFQTPSEAHSLLVSKPVPQSVRSTTRWPGQAGRHKKIQIIRTNCLEPLFGAGRLHMKDKQERGGNEL